jgi:aryl-alcohol dehydrogenase-like predicted oxidoreductase
MPDFLHSVLDRTGWPVHRIGLSASYRPSVDIVGAALDMGVNFFFGFGIDSRMIRGLRAVFPSQRDKVIVATGAYNLIIGSTNLRRTLEKRLRQLKTDYIDVFMFLGVMKPKEFPDRIRDELMRLRDEGKVRAIGISTHDRKLAGIVADRGELDLLMIRYNAAHRGAEKDIFPHCSCHNPALVAYTATRWTALLRRPKGWPENRPIPTPSMAYRFVLNNPSVHVCLMAPRSRKEFEANFKAVADGPLSEDELKFMKEFGDVVHAQREWFM